MPTTTLRSLFWLLALLPSLAFAGVGQFQEGKDYQRLPQDFRTRNPDKIEVVEVFWYGCVHCYHFEPLLSAWRAKLPDDVDFWRSPAMWNAPMALHAKMFYTADALGKQEELHMPLFTAMNVERKRFKDADEIGAFFAKYGVSDAEFRKVFSSFGVGTAVRQADARARGYKVTGTPELIVAGKYRVSSSLSGDHASMLQVVDYLIGKERALLAASGTPAAPVVATE